MISLVQDLKMTTHEEKKELNILLAEYTLEKAWLQKCVNHSLCNNVRITEKENIHKKSCIAITVVLLYTTVDSGSSFTVKPSIS